MFAKYGLGNLDNGFKFGPEMKAFGPQICTSGAIYKNRSCESVLLIDRFDLPINAYFSRIANISKMRTIGLNKIQVKSNESS